MVQMFLLAGVGFLLYKGGKITQEDSKTLGKILIYASLPAVIINGFRVERTAEHVSGILWSAAGALVLLLVSVLISHFVFRKDPIGAFAGAFSNPGFFGVPLMIASLGQGAVFYAASFIAFLNIGQWTYGVSRLNGQPLTEGLKLEKLIQAPFVIAILAGLILFATQIPLPDVIVNCITTLAGLNTPLAMFTVGVFLAQTDFWKMFRKKELYLVSAVRLLLVTAAGGHGCDEDGSAARCFLSGRKQCSGVCTASREELSLRSGDRDHFHHAVHPDYPAGGSFFNNDLVSADGRTDLMHQRTII